MTKKKETKAAKLRRLDRNWLLGTASRAEIMWVMENNPGLRMQLNKGRAG